MIQLTKVGMIGTVDFDTCAREFEESHAFRLPGLLSADLVRIVYSRLELSAWTPHEDGKIASETLPEDPAPGGILNFAVNTIEFLELIRRITSCDIKTFGGRIYQMAPASLHHDSWHADIGKTHTDRLVGMSINLSARPYEGGRFRLRDGASGAILCELTNTGQGDAIFFRISRDLQHMVTPIVGCEPKIAFAGWFRSGASDFYSSLQR